jgi:hypothetical protein
MVRGPGRRRSLSLHAAAQAQQISGQRWIAAGITVCAAVAYLRLATVCSFTSRNKAGFLQTS